MAGVLIVLSVMSLSCVGAQVIGSNGSGVVTPSEHHKHLDGCLLPNTKELMPFNETRSLPERCLQVTCQQDRTISYQHCEPVLVPQECTQTDYNNSLPYPQCCPVMVCENSTVLNDTNSTNSTTSNGAGVTHSNTTSNPLETTTHLMKIVQHKNVMTKLQNEAITVNEPQCKCKRGCE